MTAMRRTGLAEAMSRAIYRRAGDREIDALALLVGIMGLSVGVSGALTTALYVEMSAGDLAVLCLLGLGFYGVDGLLAWRAMRRLATPLDGAAALALPTRLLRRWELYAVAAVAAASFDVAMSELVGVDRIWALLVLPGSFGVYIAWAMARALVLELALRPVLEDLGGAPPDAAPHIGLRWRLLAVLPAINWGTGVVVAGLLTDERGDLETLAIAVGVAAAVTLTISIWMTLLLAEAVSGPVTRLRDATRSVARGDFDVRVPVVSTDEAGELAAAFNEMTAGLAERERLRDAFGAFVDPTLTERVLAEGTDLSGEQLEVTVLFVDVRGFTAFSEAAGPHDVVARLNDLFGTVVPVVLRHGGHANKFIGDGLLAVFGAPVRHPDHADRAVAAALEIAACAPLPVGIGVNTGPVVAGTVGGGGRVDFTVIGDTVNTAARIERATRTTGDAVLGAETTRAPFAGTRVTWRTSVRSAAGAAGRSAARRRTVAMTTRISICANAAPRQRRTPPPNGIHVYGAAAPPSRKRSGRKA